MNSGLFKDYRILDISFKPLMGYLEAYSNNATWAHVNAALIITSFTTCITKNESVTGNIHN